MSEGRKRGIGIGGERRREERRGSTGNIEELWKRKREREEGEK